jgi:hypothetical protein
MYCNAAAVFCEGCACSWVIGVSARPNKLDIDGKQQFEGSSTGGDRGA